MVLGPLGWRVVLRGTLTRFVFDSWNLFLSTSGRAVGILRNNGPMRLVSQEDASSGDGLMFARGRIAIRRLSRLAVGLGMVSVFC